MKQSQKQLTAYLSRIGRHGGKKSRRALSAEDARRMVQVREARKAFRLFYAQCFWSSAREFRPGANDIEWVASQLRKHGGRAGWKVASKLCP